MVMGPPVRAAEGGGEGGGEGGSGEGGGEGGRGECGGMSAEAFASVTYARTQGAALDFGN